MESLRLESIYRTNERHGYKHLSSVRVTAIFLKMETFALRGIAILKQICLIRVLPALATYRHAALMPSTSHKLLKRITPFFGHYNCQMNAAEIV